MTEIIINVLPVQSEFQITSINMSMLRMNSLNRALRSPKLKSIFQIELLI